MLHKQPDSIHYRNKLLVQFLWVMQVFYIFYEIVLEKGLAIFLEGTILLGMAILLIISILLWKRKWINFVRYILLIAIFLYFYFLINSYPNNITFIFMWLGLIVTTIYQSYHIILLAGFLSIVMTWYSFYRYQDKIFPGLENSDIIYLLMFACFLMGFLLFFTRFTRTLCLQSEQNQKQLKNILDSMDMATWSYDMHMDRVFVSDGIEKITGVPSQELMKDQSRWKQMIHPYDSLRVKQAQQDLLAGNKKVFEFRIILANGDVRWLQNLSIPVQEQRGKTFRLDGLIIDISEQKQVEEKMKHMAYYDVLTGLPNRAMFENYFNSVLARGRFMEQKLAVVFIDLDHFKAVNDNLGHDIGDLLLQAVGKRLKTALRDTDVLARLGGDEFIALLTGISKEKTVFIAERIIEALSQPFAIEGHKVMIGASIGISMYPQDGMDIETLIKNADQAMYQVKERGKNSYQLYNK